MDSWRRCGSRPWKVRTGGCRKRRATPRRVCPIQRRRRSGSSSCCDGEFATWERGGQRCCASSMASRPVTCANSATCCSPGRERSPGVRRTWCCRGSTGRQSNCHSTRGSTPSETPNACTIERAAGSAPPAGFPTGSGSPMTGSPASREGWTNCAHPLPPTSCGNWSGVVPRPERPAELDAQPATSPSPTDAFVPPVDSKSESAVRRGPTTPSRSDIPLPMISGCMPGRRRVHT